MSIRRCRPPTAVFGALVAAVIASGCSVTGSDRPAGLLPAEEVAIDPAASPAAERRDVQVTAGGPPVELSSGLTLRFEDAPGAVDDPPTSAVLDDSAMLFAAMYQAIDRGDPDDALYQRYASEQVQAALRDVIAVFASNGWTATGTAIVYRRSAELTDTDEASVAWCADLRTVLPMEISSGHVLESAPGDHSYLRYEGTMERSSSGLWVMTSLQSQRADPACL